MAPLVTSPPSSARGVRDNGFDDEALAHTSSPMLCESGHKQTPDASLPWSLTSPRPAPSPPSTSSTPTTSLPTTRLLPPPPLSPPPIPGSTNLFFYASRTPMQLVTLSNIKLNNDMYSTRSLSILRRVLVKNLLTLLYDTNPLLDYWFDNAYQNEGVGVGSGTSSGQCGARGHEGSVPEPLLGEDEQNGWIEQTLNAAGLNDDDEDDDDELADPHRHHQKTRDERTTGINNNSNNAHGTGNKAPYTPANPFARSSATLPSPFPTPQPSHSPSISRPSSPPPSFSQSPNNDKAKTQPLPPISSPPSPHSFMSFPTPIPRAPRSSSSPNTPSRLSLSTSRPKSAELPQFLNSYLSAVFDVDWSVGLPSTEDSLFIQKSSLSSSPPVVTSSLSSPKRISDSSASVSSFSSRSSTASLSSSMTSVEGGSQKSVEELSLSKGKLWDENGSIPIPLLSKPTPPLDANTSSNKKIHTGKSILVKKSQPSLVNGNSTSIGTTSKEFPNKGDGGIKKKSSPPLPPVPTLKIQNNKPKVTLVPGRRSSLMQTGQLPAVSSPNTKGPLLATTSTPTSTPPTIEVTAPISVLSFPTVPSTISFPVDNTVESAASQSSPKFARRTSSLTSERTGYQNRKALSSESLIAPSSGLPRPLDPSGSPISAILAASQSSGGTTAISLSNFPSVPTGLPQSSYGATPDGNLGGRTAKAGWSPSEQPQEQSLKQKTYNSYVIHTAPITMPTSPLLPYSEPAGFPPSRSRSPPQAPRQLAIVSSTGNVHSSQLPPSSSPTPPRSPSRSQSSAPTLPPLFPVPLQDQSYGSKTYSSSPISLNGQRQEQYQKSQQQYLLPPYTFARSVSDDELQSRSYNASSKLSPPVNIRPTASYSIKTSRSSPDLMSSSEVMSYNNSGGLPPLPNAPAQYHNQHPRDQAYQYPGSPSRTTSVRKPIAPFVSAPLPQIPSFKGQANSSGHEERRSILHDHGYGSKGSPSVASTRWNSMKLMLGLKSGSGKA